MTNDTTCEFIDSVQFTINDVIFQNFLLYNLIHRPIEPCENTRQLFCVPQTFMVYIMFSQKCCIDWVFVLAFFDVNGVNTC